MLNVLAAKTHPSQYLLHKYWARKPYNVLSEIIKTVAEDKSITVLDPFCGSGVFINEASIQGHKCHAFDVNPVAYMLTKTTCKPPSAEKFKDEIDQIIEGFKQVCDNAYGNYKDQDVRYIVHEAVVKCKECGKEVSFSSSKKDGRLYRCPFCANRVNFNLKSLLRTNVVSARLDQDTISNLKFLQQQDELSCSTYLEELSKYNFEFLENKRILSYKGMTTSDLYTKRNFSLLCWLANKINDIEDDSIKEAALLLLTASAAQCSRLIAYRNNMKTGGPAWSVPGFWVPPTHLETNPYYHVIARYKKFLKGLKNLTSQNKEVFVYNDDAKNLSSYDDINDIDLVFLDPPYGDSVPYMEFSMLWNSFIGFTPDIKKDISVSDRLGEKKESWLNYFDSLEIILKEISAILSSKGKVLLTFNNHDTKAWEALLKSIQEAGLRCKDTIYQIPAVVSSKAQFSPEGSYVSDIYAVFELNNGKKYRNSYEAVINDLIASAESRGGKLPKSVFFRIVFMSFVDNNIHHSLLGTLQDVINEYFILDAGYYTLKDRSHGSQHITIKSICEDTVDALLSNGSCDWNELYTKVALASKDIGIPDPWEVREVLEDKLLFKNKKCYLIKSQLDQELQQSLF